ncbi:hypothetical protein BM525_19260 (plasmid) [Alteromonas mediterranea]|uniref:Uncharacterized protein n=1 Tax=Alteromonas mediterranea TaxID=314275 RepID=A0AAC9JHU6_9ALTE|nr:hypothetical protein [Alteromonas mediterranea]APD92023.1 hypothetical protein BM524_19065 [Alteromonas mediterranea]APD99877.1 hypothetical protein BM525_19260 [Alteromonas mediterranea]
MNLSIIKTFPTAIQEIAKSNDTALVLIEQIGSFENLPVAFQKLLSDTTRGNQSDNAVINMLICVHQKRFYAECVPCASGQFSMGISEVDGVEIPALYATPAEAFESYAEEVTRYRFEIECGERDEDDEYEGSVCIIAWDGGDLVSIYDFSYPPLALAESSPWRWHAGNPRKIDNVFYQQDGHLNLDKLAPYSTDVARYITPTIAA